MSMTPNEAARFLQLPKPPAVRMTYSEEEMQQARKDAAEKCVEIIRRCGWGWSSDLEDLIESEIKKEFGIK